MKRKLSDCYEGEIDVMNEAHLEFIFKKWYSKLVLHAYCILKDADEAEDILSEVFIKFNHSGRVFPSENEAKNYLYTSVRNKCHDELAKKATKDRGETAYQQYIKDDVDFIPERTNSDIFEMIHEIAEKHLTPSQQEVFYSRYFLHLSMEKVGAKLGYEYQTLKNITYLSMKKLKEACQNNEQLVDLYRQPFHS